MVPRGRPAVAVSIATVFVIALTVGGILLFSGGKPSEAFFPTDPTIGPSGASLTYPSDYATLAQHVLDLINQERSAAGLQPVVMSKEPSGQQHADSMMYFGYFSHWDAQGYKPYMRYTLLNGSGAVFENVAWSHSPQPLFESTTAAKAGLDDLHYRMMYDDSFDNWGHRITILDPSHNAVSIGVAYNSTDLYMVEDFENNYTSLKLTYSPQSGMVWLQGQLGADINPLALQVYFDPPPKDVSAFQLMTVGNFTGPYSAGTYAGSVFPACSIYCPAPTGNVSLFADVWSSSTNLSLQFDLRPFISVFGPGVYTLYLQNATGTTLTSRSVYAIPP